MSKKKHRSLSWKEKYSACGELGKGGNGVVNLVERLSDKARFALKILVENNKEKKHRFITEIATVNKYSDKIKGIIPIIDFSDTEFWYVMPIATECMNYIKSNDENIVNIIKGTIQLCETLCQLHSLGISHRDIKPPNIYIYEERYAFSDFGLASTPDGEENFTNPNKPLGAIFTIAPEMKRDPNHADGKKADVYSLAKTMWMFLSRNEKGFDGVYNYLDPSHSLSYIQKYKGIHLVEIHELLKEATDNNPYVRPSISQFKARLEEWLAIYDDEEKSQISDWKFLDKQLFGALPPDSANWKTPKKIVDVLNIIGTTPAFNHMLLSSRGGLDFEYAKLANEQSCIEIYADGFCHIIKPKQLIYDGFGKNCEWNYFLLELDGLKPIISDSEFKNEMLVEDSPAHYVSASTAQYGVYDYDTGEPFPDGYRIVYRYTGGKFLIVMKWGPYNHINSTYDGRHGLCDSTNFRRYIEHLIKNYTIIFEKSLKDDRFDKLDKNKIKRRILNLPEFTKNPFIENYDNTVERLKMKERVSERTASIDYLKNNYDRICFRNLTDDDKTENENIRFYFEFTVPDGKLRLDFFNGSGQYIGTDGYIREFGHLMDENCFYVHDRHNAMLFQERFENDINYFLKQNGLHPLADYCQCISVKLKKAGKPIHLFTRLEIEKIMRNADDRVENQLVIDENGYAKIINNTVEGVLYPVRHESWNAGNVYVGKYSQLKTLDENYIMSLQGWLLYLKTGRKQYMDYLHENCNEKQLIEEIKKFY